jgi:hypothetical protein
MKTPQTTPKKTWHKPVLRKLEGEEEKRAMELMKPKVRKAGGR